jgi:hypothetical protein
VCARSQDIEAHPSASIWKMKGTAAAPRDADAVREFGHILEIWPASSKIFACMNRIGKVQIPVHSMQMNVCIQE